MIQRVEQTEEEKIKMYMKLPKRELINMLIECHKIIEEFHKEYLKNFIVPEVNIYEE